MTSLPDSRLEPSQPMDAKPEVASLRECALRAMAAGSAQMTQGRLATRPAVLI